MRLKLVASFLFNKITPTIVKSKIEKKVFDIVARNIEQQIVFRSKIDSRMVFCIVHWNAPDYLLLNVDRIFSLYPNSKIYVLDNGSLPTNFNDIKKSLARFDNVTLFSAPLRSPNLITKVGLDQHFRSYTHPKGLQFLLNYSAEQSDEIAVFLDQDCILSNKIELLLYEFNKKILLIGARDYVVIPKDYGPLKKGKLRNAPHCVHASFMILQPKIVNQLFGRFSLFLPREYLLYPPRSHQPEAYHGISFKAKGRILFLETRMHETVPFLTSYAYQGVIYAWHAWYSSRMMNLPSHGRLDSLPVSWLRDVRLLSYEHLKRIQKAQS